MKHSTHKLEWLIIGGGIHGVHVAARLVGEGNIDPERVCLLDPAKELLSRWRTCTRTTGMSYLRSPGVHHLDQRPFSLIRFAGGRRHQRRGLLKLPYDRPSLDLFDAHCDRVIERYGLRRRHLRGRAVRCQPERGGVRIVTSNGIRLHASRVVLALGASEQPAWPDWAPRDDARIQHIFARGFTWPTREDNEDCLVVGGGISAAQVALRLASEGRPVHLVTRHPPRVHRFDSDPGWLGPKLMPIFQRERDLVKRRHILHKVRHRGSMPKEVHRAIQHAVAKERLTLHQAGVAGVCLEQGRVRLRLDTGRSLDGGHLLLATGFDGRRPGGPMLDRLITSARLPCAPCGYPVVDSWLRWHPRIHVTGPLAELELGPVSRNIAGARRAGDRILATVKSAQLG